MMAKAEIHFGLKPIDLFLNFLRPKGRSYSNRFLFTVFINYCNPCELLRLYELPRASARGQKLHITIGL